MPTILLTNYYDDGPLSIIRGLLPAGFTLLALDRPGRGAIIERAPYADYFLVGGRTLISREILAMAPRLKMLQRSGVGLDSLDLEELSARRIPVYVNSGVNAQSVAEHTLLLILSVLRRLPEADQGMKAGVWRKHDLGVRCHDLAGKTVGLIGVGEIGRRVADLLRPFGVVLLYATQSLTDGKAAPIWGRNVPLDELLRCADIVSLHCPLTSVTRGLIGAREIELMKEGAILVNTARGPLIEEAALISGLESSKLQGAGIDVFAQEPIAAENRLRNMPNVVLTPHVAGLTIETFSRMMREAMFNIVCFERGQLSEISDRLLPNNSSDRC